MNVTRFSSLTFHSLHRGVTTSLQAELAVRSKEATTGRHADSGLALGATVGRRSALENLSRHLGGMADSNTLASGRLDVTQHSLSGLNDLATQMISLLSAGDLLAEAAVAKIARTRATLNDASVFLNASAAGVHVFGGMNTDAAPLADYKGGAGEAAFQVAFQSHFGFAKTDPAAAAITAADMSTFLDSVVAPLFSGPSWTTNLSGATDGGLISRIAPGETATTSVSANETSVRTFMMATTVTLEMLDSAIGGEAGRAVAAFALSAFGVANKGLADLQGRVGVMQQQIDRASEAAQARRDLLDALAGDLDRVDPYEAASRVAALTTQLETSYTLTARLHELSLVRFLA